MVPRLRHRAIEPFVWPVAANSCNTGFMRARRRSSGEGPRIKAFARVLASVLFITSFPVAVMNGATTWGWTMASLGLIFGLFLLPSSLMRLATPSGQVTVDTGAHFREGENLERPRPRRDISFAIVIALICLTVLVALCEPVVEPTVPGAWFGAGWLAWIGVNAICGVDDWWQGWHVRDRAGGSGASRR